MVGFSDEKQKCGDALLTMQLAVRKQPVKPLLIKRFPLARPTVIYHQPITKKISDAGSVIATLLHIFRRLRLPGPRVMHSIPKTAVGKRTRDSCEMSML